MAVFLIFLQFFILTIAPALAMMGGAPAPKIVNPVGKRKFSVLHLNATLAPENTFENEDKLSAIDLIYTGGFVYGEVKDVNVIKRKKGFGVQVFVEDVEFYGATTPKVGGKLYLFSRNGRIVLKYSKTSVEGLSKGIPALLSALQKILQPNCLKPVTFIPESAYKEGIPGVTGMFVPPKTPVGAFALRYVAFVDSAYGDLTLMKGGKQYTVRFESCSPKFCEHAPCSAKFENGITLTIRKFDASTSHPQTVYSVERLGPSPASEEEIPEGEKGMLRVW